jgi:hypothetical protein
MEIILTSKFELHLSGSIKIIVANKARAAVHLNVI